jgi:hypothetical protein
MGSRPLSTIISQRMLVEELSSISLSVRAKNWGSVEEGRPRLNWKSRAEVRNAPLLYSAHDEEHNDGIVLEKVLLEETSKAQDD